MEDPTEEGRGPATSSRRVDSGLGCFQASELGLESFPEAPHWWDEVPAEAWMAQDVSYWTEETAAVAIELDTPDSRRGQAQMLLTIFSLAETLRIQSGRESYRPFSRDSSGATGRLITLYSVVCKLLELLMVLSCLSHTIWRAYMRLALAPIVARRRRPPSPNVNVPSFARC